MTRSVFDVAAFILEKAGPMTAMKLQKLVYYSQAWSLVWDERLLFRERVKAWANGPVVPQLYHESKGQYRVKTCPKGDASKLDKDAKETVLAVLRFYGDKTAQWLSDLTHREDPWRDARQGIPEGERGEKEITPAAMLEYYGSLQ